MNFITKDNKEIYVYRYEDVQGEIKGAVQLAHGMSEHIARYESFAKELNKAGFVVYGNDHRGHGKSVKSKDELGIIADENGFEKMVEDMYTLSCKIKEKHPNLPLFLFSHSMGSFLSQRYIMIHGEEINGVILSGSNGKNPFLLTLIGNKIADSEIKKLGRNKVSKKMDKLMFGKFNKKFSPNRTDFDWLSSIESEVDKYINDEYCGFLFSAGAYKDLLDGVEIIEQDKEIDKVPKDLPMFIISGDKDPVGNLGKGVIKLSETYKSHGMKSVKVKLYKNGRHELLNDIHREEVISDVIDFINGILSEKK